MTPLIENPFTWVYFPTALTLGALHALEPGHAKTLTAAYLIGIKGTKRDALMLGLSVAFTHSLVVVGISVAALWLGRETFTQDVTHWLQMGSGLIVILLGTWMLLKRVRQMKLLKNHHHHHAPDPIHMKCKDTQGVLEIIDTSEGERMRYIANSISPDVKLRVVINRSEQLEVLELNKTANKNEWMSSIAPNEPHEFSAEFEISKNDSREVILFKMHEPHSHMTDDKHAKAHAATIPEYAKKGERPSLGQIMAFGAAGGMIPCPASITVMLLALSIGKFSSGLLAVAGFSLGLAITLVGIGLVIVAGLGRLQGSSGKFHWFSVNAPIVSASVVILSGLAALVFAH